MNLIFYRISLPATGSRNHETKGFSGWEGPYCL